MLLTADRGFELSGKGGGTSLPTCANKLSFFKQCFCQRMLAAIHEDGEILDSTK